MATLRLCYQKINRYAFLSHLEMVRFTERAFRRARLPLAFSEGYHPHPKISFAAPAPVGITSEGEVLEVELTEAVPLEMILDRKSPLFPPGLDILDAGYVESKKSLMARIRSITYRIELPAREGLAQALKAFLKREEILVEKRTKKNKKKTVNLAPMIHGVDIDDREDHLILTATLATGSTANLNPMLLLETFKEETRQELALDQVRYHRLVLEGEEGPLFGGEES